MPSFIDKVLARREKLDALTDKAARSMANIIDRARKDAIKEVKKKLQQFQKEGQLEKSAAMQRVLKSTLADFKDTMAGVYADTQTILKEAKKTAFKLSFADTASSLKALDKEASLGSSFNQIFKEALAQSNRRTVLGVAPDNQFNGVRGWTEKQVRDVFTKAVVSGDSIEGIAGELDRITGVGERAATRIARTNMTAVMNDAHKAVYEANDDVIEGYMWNATLDGRTSLICATLHGRVWKIGEEPPGPPAHPNCRSVLTPVFKDKDVQALLDQDEQRVRNLDGKGTTLISGEVTFEDWLADQPKAGRIEFVGSEVKERLWYNGNVTFQELVKPDLSVRSDYEVIQLALAKSPSNKELQRLAAEESVRTKKLSNIRKEDKRLQNAQDFDPGRTE